MKILINGMDKLGGDLDDLSSTSPPSLVVTIRYNLTGNSLVYKFAFFVVILDSYRLNFTAIQTRSRFSLSCHQIFSFSFTVLQYSLKMQPSLSLNVFTSGHHASTVSVFLHPGVLTIIPVPHHLAISLLSFPPV